MRLTISLDDDLYRYVKARSKHEDLSMSAVINEIVRRTKEPNIEPVPLPEVRNGIPLYEPRAGAEPLDVVELRRLDEEEEDRRQARLAGLVE